MSNSNSPRNGIVQLQAGSCMVKTAAVMDISTILLSHRLGQVNSSTPIGTLHISEINEGESFLIASTSPSDFGEVSWLIVNPD